MALGKKVSGGVYKKFRKKRLCERKGKTRNVKLNEIKKKRLRVLGGNTKVVLLSSNIANVLDKKTGKIVKAKILNVIETPSNRYLARSNIMTKGTIIETEIGNAKITNRPGQEGQIQAILLTK